MSLPRRLNSTHGMSIIEVLVVMVVLLVGIMSVVSMFPGGFKAVRHAESMTFADRLAQGEMERWKNNADNLPWGVVPIDEDDSGNLYVDNDLNPNPPITDPKAFNIRRVIRETTKIPVGTPFRLSDDAPGGIEQASIYTVAYAPIDYRNVGSDAGVVITGGNMRRREMDADDQDDVYRLRQGDYGIDYESVTTEDFKMCFPVFNRDTVYHVSYSYWVLKNGKMEIRSAVDQRVPDENDSPNYIPANTVAWIPVKFQLGSDETFVRFEENSDTCARGFVELPVQESWSPDYPYEYKIVDVVLGTIAFNPYGYKAVEQTARGMRPLEAHISYNIRDLSIMRDDRRVDSTGRVKLSLKYIRKLGEPLEQPEGDGPYEGIFAKTTKTLSDDLRVDIMAIDLSTGTRIPLTDDMVDYENGIVQFPTGYTFRLTNDPTGQPVSVEGRNIRFLYKAEGDWSLQLQKAYELYMRDYGGGDVTYRSYGVRISSSTNEVKLRFAGCESGKTIAVDYAYTDQYGIEHKVVGEAHMVPDATSDFDGVTGYWVKLDFTDPAKYGANAASNTLTRFYSVYGVSLKIRVLWREGARWRYVDKDTSLMRRTTEV